MMRLDILLMGPPGVGKGTQSIGLAQRFSLTHIASGNLFRDHMREGTPLGSQAKQYIERGELVPDELVTEMVLGRVLTVDGTILDGFPRTVGQAQILTERLAAAGRGIDVAILLSAPDQALLRRIAGRQTCDVCGESYNVYYQPSRLDEVCDSCGGTLFTRSDDTMQTATHRLRVYQEQTRPLADFYQALGCLATVDGTGSPDEVAAHIDAVVPGPGVPP